MQKKHYRTVFIITPVLSDEQTKGTVEKFRTFLTKGGAEFVHEDAWGLKKLAYPIDNKTTGYYQVFEFNADPALLAPFEVEFRRDDKILRFLTTVLDKHSSAYYEKKRKGLIGKKPETKLEETN